MDSNYTDLINLGPTAKLVLFTDEIWLLEMTPDGDDAIFELCLSDHFHELKELINKWELGDKL